MPNGKIFCFALAKQAPIVATKTPLGARHTAPYTLTLRNFFVQTNPSSVVYSMPNGKIFFTMAKHALLSLQKISLDVKYTATIVLAYARIYYLQNETVQTSFAVELSMHTSFTKQLQS